MTNQIVELIAVTQDITWNSWAVQYFFFIGLSVGGLLLSLPAFVLGKVNWEPVGRIALLVAITTGLVAPVALISDLHQPARFYQFYLHFTPDSWMSWGAFFLPCYLAVLALYSWRVFSNRQAMVEANVRIIGAVAALFAMLVAVYTGSEMGVLMSRPLWYGSWLIPLYLVTGLSGAVGLILILAAVFEPAKTAVTAYAYRSLLQMQFLVLLCTSVWVGMGVYGLSDSGLAFKDLALGYADREVISWLAIGTLLPLIIAAIRSPSMGWVAGLLALFGAWMFRWVMFIGGQGMPKNGAGYYPFDLPAGAEGWAGIIGSLGLWLFLIILITSLLPWQRSAHSA